MKHFLIAAAIAATTLTTSPLLAAVYSSATLSGYTFELVDLDENDGITPSVTYNNITRQISGILNVGQGVSQSFAINEINTDSLSETLSETNSTVSSFSNGSLSSASLGSNGSTSGLNSDGFSGAYSGFSNDLLDFTLSPQTQLKISAESNITRESTVAGEFSQSFSQLQLFSFGFISADTHNPNSLTDTFSLNETMMLSILFDNFSNSAFNGILSSYTQVAGESFAAPSAVPVPAALPLMASALGAFGIARRRKQKSA